MAEKQQHGIGTRTLRAMFWAYGSFVGGSLLALAATAILARLLTPEDFGLVALALIAMAFLDMLPGLGVGDALVIVDEDEVAERAETVFAVQVLVGLVLAVALAALGPFAAAFFGQPMLVELMAVLSLSFVLRGFGGTHAALAQKRLDFRSRTAAEIADALVRGVVSVILALAGAGVWSLILGYVAGSAAWTVTLWLLVSWRPHFHPRRAHLRSLLRFGGTLTGVGVMAAFLTQFDYLVVGRVLGAAQLGFYSMATRLPSLFILGLAAVAGRVLFPAFASLHVDNVRRAFLMGLRYTALVALPLTAFLAILAKPITIVLLGDQWGPSIEAMQVLCVWAGAGTFGLFFGNVYKGRGHVGFILVLAVPQAVALVIGTLLLVDRGIVAVAWVQTGIVIAALIASTGIAKRLFELRVREMMQSVYPAVLGTVVLAVVLVAVEHSISSPWTAVLIGAGTGAVVYFGTIRLLAPEALTAVRSMAFPRTPAGEP